MKKRNLSVSLVLLMGLGALAACSQPAASSSSAQPSTESSSATGPSSESSSAASSSSVVSSSTESSSAAGSSESSVPASSSSEEPASSSSSSEEPEPEPEPTFDVQIDAEQLPNKPKFKLKVTTTENKAIDTLDVKVAYRDINAKETTYHLDQYDLLKGYVLVDGAFGINDVTVVAHSGDEFSNPVSKKVGLFADEYNIAPLIATVPVTIYSLSFPSYTNDYSIPTLFYLERGAAWDYSHLPANTYPIPLYTADELKETRSDQGDYTARTAEYVKELYSLNKDSKFNFYMNDMWCEAWIAATYPNGVPEANITLKLLSDGTWSYSWFNGLFNTPTGLEKRTAISDIWATAKTSMGTNKDYKASYLGGYSARDFILAWLEDDSLEGKVEWVINRIDTIQNASEYPEIKTLVDDLYSAGKIVRYNLGNLYSALSDKDKAEIKALYNINDYFKATLEAGHIPTVALGTSTAGETNLEEYLVISKDVLGDTSDVYYKGHPGYPTYDTDPKKAMFEKLGIEELPGALAAELFYYFCGDSVKYIGYGSSTFTNVGDESSVMVWKERYEDRSANYGDYMEYFVTPVTADDAKYGAVVSSTNSFFLVQKKADLVEDIFSEVTAYEFNGVELVGKKVYSYDSANDTYVEKAAA